MVLTPKTPGYWYSPCDSDEEVIKDLLYRDNTSYVWSLTPLRDLDGFEMDKDWEEDGRQHENAFEYPWFDKESKLLVPLELFYGED